MSSNLLSPDGVHVADKWPGTAEVVIAYGFYTDECQAVVTLMPRYLQHAGPIGGGGEGPSNYVTFFQDAPYDGSRYDIQYHANIVAAIERYSNEMGMDI